MEHQSLGLIRHDEKTGEYRAAIKHGTREIPIGIQPDGDPLKRVIAQAAAVADRLDHVEQVAKNAAAAQLLEQYNDSWRAYDEAQGDGTFKTVCNPMLSEAEFMTRLSLSAINVTGVDCVDCVLDDGGLFAGHRVIVTSFDGLVFSDTSATLFG